MAHRERGEEGKRPICITDRTVPVPVATIRTYGTYIRGRAGPRLTWRARAGCCVGARCVASLARCGASRSFVLGTQSTGARQASAHTPTAARMPRARRAPNKPAVVSRPAKPVAGKAVAKPANVDLRSKRQTRRTTCETPSFLSGLAPDALVLIAQHFATPKTLISFRKACKATHEAAKGEALAKLVLARHPVAHCLQGFSLRQQLVITARVEGLVDPHAAAHLIPQGSPRVGDSAANPRGRRAAMPLPHALCARAVGRV